jgi:hypothetical protein
VNINLEGASENVRLDVFNSTGLEILGFDLSPNGSGFISQSIDLSSTPNGIYLLRFQGKYLQKSVKIIRH